MSVPGIFSTLTASGLLSAEDGAVVTGNISADTIGVGGAVTVGTLGVTGDAIVTGNLTVDQLLTAGNGLVVDGNISATTAGVGGAVTVGTLGVSGAASVVGRLTVDDLLTAGNGAVVTGNISADDMAVGSLNADLFQMNGTAPLGHQLIGNGTHYVDTAATPRTSNANGSFKIDTDGTITQWGSVSVPAAGVDTTATITYPIAFTTSAVLNVNLVGVFTSDSTTPAAVQVRSASLTGAIAYMARVIEAGAGGGTFDSPTFLQWHAIGV
jgi:cytoskeletal protein CcmA (bactofilin family)